MHRRSNLQCSELNRDFSIKTHPITCDVNSLPQNMRPFSNRLCNNYDYTKNGLVTYGADPVKTCAQKENFTVENMAPYPQSLMSYSAYPYVTLYDIPTVRPIPTYTVQQVPVGYVPATVATRNNSRPVTFIPATPILAGNRCAGNGTLNSLLIENDRNYAVMPHFVPAFPASTASIGIPTRNNSMFVTLNRM